MPDVESPDAYLAALVEPRPRRPRREPRRRVCGGLGGAGRLPVGAKRHRRRARDRRPDHRAARSTTWWPRCGTRRCPCRREDSSWSRTRGRQQGLVVPTRASRWSSTPAPRWPFARPTALRTDPPADGLFWYALDRSILSGNGRSLLGPPAHEVFADVDADDLRRLLVEALGWWVRQPGDPVDAVLGACRSLVRYRDGVWLAKVAAGRRLIASGHRPPGSWQAAVAARLGAGPPPSPADARAFQRRVRAEIRGTRLRPLTPADVDALVSLQKAGGIAGLGHVFPQDTHPFPRERITARWRAEIDDPDTEALAVEVDGVLQRVRRPARERAPPLRHGRGELGQRSGRGRPRARGRPDWLGTACGPRGCGCSSRTSGRSGLYERLGWQRTGETRTSTFPPNPTLVAYRLDLSAALSVTCRPRRSSPARAAASMKTCLMSCGFCAT